MNEENKKELIENLNTVHWSFTDDGWQSSEDNGMMKPSSFEFEAMYNVLEYFKDKNVDDNYIIKILKAVKKVNYEIVFDENVDSFGEHIEYYYDGKDKLIEEFVDDKIEIVKFDKAFDELLNIINGVRR